MKKFIISTISIAVLLLMGFESKATNNDPFYKAQWIGMTELDNSMKVVPAVHGKGDKLGNKAIERSIVPMFRKDFYEPNDVKKATIYIS